MAERWKISCRAISFLTKLYPNFDFKICRIFFFQDQYGETVSVAYAIEGDNGGIYTCTVETAADRVTVVQRIIVNSSPPFVSKFKGNVAVSALKRVPEYYVIQGSNLTVTCNVTKGIPHPQITWKKSVDLSEKPDSLKIYETNQTLQLTNLEVNDEGNYSCLAVNEYGQDQVGLIFQVAVKVLLQIQ